MSLLKKILVLGAIAAVVAVVATKLKGGPAESANWTTSYVPKAPQAPAPQAPATQAEPAVQLTAGRDEESVEAPVEG